MGGGGEVGGAGKERIRKASLSLMSWAVHLGFHSWNTFKYKATFISQLENHSSIFIDCSKQETQEYVIYGKYCARGRTGSRGSMQNIAAKSNFNISCERMAYYCMYTSKLRPWCLIKWTLKCKWQDECWTASKLKFRTGMGTSCKTIALKNKSRNTELCNKSILA